MRKRAILLVILVALTAFGLLPARLVGTFRDSVRDACAPFLRAARAGSAGLADRLAGLARAEALRAEQLRTAEEMAYLRDRIRAVEQVESENRELRRMLQFRQAQRRRLLAAEVLSRGDVGGWWHSLRLARGGREGVEVNMAVITPDGLLGRVSSVTPDTCDVLLLTDPGCEVSVRIVRNGRLGILRGRERPSARPELDLLAGCAPYELTYVEGPDELQPQDEVVTSGLGGVYPGGIHVGYVARSQLDETGLYLDGDVVPSVDFERVRHVFVVIQ